MAEKRELDDKVARLRTFLIGPSVEIDKEDRELMERQLEVMNMYSEILKDRIGRF